MEQSYWSRYHSTRRGFLRGIGVAAGALTLAPAIAACRASGKHSGSSSGAESAPRPVRGGTLTSSLPSDVSSLDYAFNNDVYSMTVIANCIDPLVMMDTQGQATGLLATSWENPDDRTYVFHLRPGVKFQDGTDFNADAVEYSLNRIRGNKTSTSYAGLVLVDKITKPDQSTVKLTLSSPFAPLLYSLGNNAGRVISPAIGEKYGSDRLKVDLTDLGTGPFKFVEWKKDDHVTLVRNEGYWRRDAFGTQPPYVDKLIYRVIPDANAALAALRNGELDVIGLGTGSGPPQKDVTGVKADPSLSYAARPTASYGAILFNEAMEPFGNRELRQAVCYAIDRAAISHSVFFDVQLPSDTIFTPAIWTYDPVYHPYLKGDLGKAKQLLAQAGRPNGFSFTLTANGSSPTAGQQAELIKDQLKEAGIEMTIRLVDYPKLLDELNHGQHQAANMTVTALQEPNSPIYPNFSSHGAQNAWTHFSNPEVDRLLEQGRTTLDPAARKPIYQQAQKLIVDAAAACVLSAATASVASSRKLHNVPVGFLAGGSGSGSQVWKSS